MGSHPINLALRFVLELGALASLGVWGWRAGANWLGWILAVGLPLIAAAAWGAFAVANDPSRSGAAPIPVPGLIRLGLELCLFALAVACLHSLGWGRVGIVFAIVVGLHYLASYDRVLWLVRQ